MNLLCTTYTPYMPYAHQTELILIYLFHIVHCISNNRRLTCPSAIFYEIENAFFLFVSCGNIYTLRLLYKKLFKAITHDYTSNIMKIKFFFFYPLDVGYFSCYSLLKI